MKNFLKENAVIVAGVALPFVLTLFFFIAMQFEKATAPLPKYSVIFAENNNSYRTDRIIVKNSKVYLKNVPSDKNHHRNRTDLRLFVFAPGDNFSEEISLPEISDTSKEAEILIPELEKYNVSSKKTSPDGYSFRQNYRHGNLMTEIFGGGYNRRSRYVLEKKPHRISVPNTTKYKNQFVGWIVPKKGNR